jgi:hypothetical protein
MAGYYTQETVPAYYGVNVGDDGHFYNDNGERVYYWVPSGEIPEKHSRHDAGLFGQIQTEDRYARNLTINKGGFYTESEIKSAFNADKGMTTLSSQVSWDNYWGYLQERQGLVETGQLTTGLDAWQAGKDARNQMLQDGGGLRAMGGAKEGVGAMQQVRGDAYRSSYMDIINGDTQTALMEKWGIPTQHQTNDGSLYQFNGSSFTKVFEPREQDFVSTAAQIGTGIALSAALGPAIGGKLGGGILGKAVGAGAASAATQGLTTGSIDPKSVLASSVVGGLNPGGMLAENFGQATNTGLNIVPDNVVGGFIQGAGNSAVSQLITDGSIDLQSALIAGGLGAGTKAVTDLFDDTSQRSIESEMRRISAERSAQGLPPLSADELYDAAVGNLSLANTSGSGMGPPEYGGPNSMVGRTDLAGLIGKDGLLSFIPALPTTGLNRFLGGGQWAIGEYFIGPDGKRYTDTEMWEMGVDPVAVYNGEVEGWEHFKDPITPIDTNTNGFLDALANEQFENTYGINPNAYIAGGGSARDLVRMITYGPLDETYNFSVNPRGTTEILGLLTGIDQYTTGSNNISANLGDGRSITDAINISDMQDVSDASKDAILSGGNTSVIVNLDGETTVVDGNTVLPGSNTTVTDAVLQGIIDGIFVSNDDPISGTVTDDDTVASTDTAVTSTSTTADENQNTGGGAGNDLNTGIDSNDVSTGSNTDVIIDGNEIISGSEELPTSSGGGGGGGGDINFIGKDGLPPLWTELFGYTKISPYKKARLRVLEGMLGGMMGGGVGNFNDFQFGANKDPYQRIGKSLYEAGIKE